jgi:drug/metabolite transporter (DMT)-like permease
MRSHLWPGVPLALLSAVLFGASAPFAKLLLGAVSPQMLAGLLYLGAGRPRGIISDAVGGDSSEASTLAWRTFADQDIGSSSRF